MWNLNQLGILRRFGTFRLYESEAPCRLHALAVDRAIRFRAPGEDEVVLLAQPFVMRLHLQKTTPGARFRSCGDENFHVGLRADDGADITAVEHGAGRARGKVLLEGEQRRANLRDRRDDRSGLAHLGSLEPRIAKSPDVECGRSRGRMRNIIEPMSRFDHPRVTMRAV